MADTAGFLRREFGEAKPGLGCMWDKPECPLSQKFWDDMIRLGSVKSAARRVRAPWLVHGLADDVVPPGDSRDLFAVAHEPRQLAKIPEADHVFSAPHTATMASAVVAWLRQLKL